MTRRRRKLLIRIGVAASVFFAVCWVVSLKKIVVLHYSSVFIGCGNGLVGGGVGVAQYQGSLGFEFDDNLTMNWLRPDFRWDSTMGDFGLVVPAWIPTVLIITPTIILWRRDRRLLPNHCKCGYDLTGNVSGVCPECGTPIEKA